MTERFVASNLDLSLLPAPEVIKSLDYEVDLAARLASLKARFEAAGIEFDVEMLETDPAVILQQEDAYRALLDKAAINDAARSVMLAFATGGNLDNLAAFYGVVRLVITPADPQTQTPAVLESDSDLRRRVQMAPEALPYAGMTGGGYRSLALRTATGLKDVSTIKRSGGRVDVVLLSRTGNGQVDDDTVNTVYAVFQDDAATQLTDIVAVRSAEIVNYTVDLTLRIPIGPDPALVRATARANVQAYATSRHRVGLPIYLTGIIAAAQAGNVEQVIVAHPTADLIIKPDQAAYCTAINVTSEQVS